MCGGGNNDAQKQATQAEAERQKQIQQSVDQINAIFGSPDRQKQYDQLAQDTTNYYTGDLDRQNKIATRKLGFSLARSGLTGGSAQGDEGKQLGQDYLRGVVEASRRGRAAAAGLQGQDEQTKQSLIAMAEAGLDTTTAGSEAASSLRSNLAASQPEATANSLGDFFGDLNGIYQSSQDAANARKGQLYGYGQIFQPIYGPGSAQPTQNLGFY